MDNTEVPRIAPIVRTDTLITIDTAIPRVATTDPFSVPGSTSAASFIWSFISTIWNENEKTQRHYGCICDHLIFYDRNGIL